MRLRLVPPDTRFDFMGMRRWAIGGSAILCLLSLLSVFAVGLNFGIDFRGGTLVMARSEGTVDLAAYRAALGALNLGEVSITEISDPAAQLTGAGGDGVLIRVGQRDGAEGAAVDTPALVRDALTAVDPGFRIQSVETVGAKVSGELMGTALIALGLAIAAILIYIWLRFEWQFAVGAVVALVHDVIITVGFFVAMRLEFNLTIVAALLTLIGYGINDTVVVFDRVRENLRRYKTMPLADLLNLSVNQTLARTIMTAMTTFIAVFAMFTLGGDVIRGFTIAMLWGIFVGAYSTVFIASVALLWLGVEREPAADPAGVKFGVREGTSP
jgi:preprotein translocase subunit SecF